MPEFYEEHLSLNLADYPNIGINFYISRWLLFVFLIITVGALINHYRKSCSLFLLGELMTKNAVGEGSGISTQDLITKGMALKLALSYKKVSRLLGSTRVKDNDDKAQSEKKNKKKIKLIYIKEKRLEDAKEVAELTCPTLGRSLLFLLLMLSIYVCIIFALPELLMFINKILK